MARYKLPDTRAFKAKSDVIEVEIKNMRDHSRTFNPCPLTMDEWLEVLVRPEDREMATKARTIFKNHLGGSFEATFRDMCGFTKPGKLVATLSTTGEPAFLLPDYVTDSRAFRPHDGSFSPAAMKLKNWVAENTDHINAWGLVLATFRELNMICGKPEQVRFYWPSVLVFLNRIEGMKDMAEKLTPWKALSYVPSIPRELMEACRETAGIVSQALLFPSTPNREPYALANHTFSAHMEPTPWALGRSLPV